MTLENNFFIIILMGITFKYIVVSVVAKTWLSFRESTREIPKSRSKFTKNAKLNFLLFLPSCPNQLQRCLAFGWVLLEILRRI